VFQVHGVDESGAVIVRRRSDRRNSLRSRKAAGLPVGIEAHHWAREL
jgi:hypothetical protein